MIINKQEDLESLEYVLRNYTVLLSEDIETKKYQEELIRRNDKDFQDAELVMLKDLNKSLNSIYKRVKKQIEKSMG